LKKARIKPNEPTRGLVIEEQKNVKRIIVIIIIIFLLKLFLEKQKMKKKKEEEKARKIYSLTIFWGKFQHFSK
jgi:hypothetical protein